MNVVDLLDVNILLHAFREVAPDHAGHKAYVQSLINGENAYGICDFVFSAFLRMATDPRIFRPAASLEKALEFVHTLREPPHAVNIATGPRHWEIFVELCRHARVTGNLVPDAYLAALAIESGCEWVTTDRDFARFPELKWRHPLEGPGR